MPLGNAFRHQPYADQPPPAEIVWVRPPELAIGSLAEAGAIYRRAGITRIYLVHGTFVGRGVAGIWTELLRFNPVAGAALGELRKSLFDQLTGDCGNYTDEYVAALSAGINPPGAQPIRVELFDWCSDNSHIGRAEGAVRLLHTVLTAEPGERFLLWGHSHGGNLFALLTNLLGGDAASRAAFFEATSVQYRSPLSGTLELPVWEEVQRLLDQRGELPTGAMLDLVTFGTPVRYGWETGGYRRLLHVINHTPQPGLEPHRASFPPQAEHITQASAGDFVQHIGIAGTNFLPSPVLWRAALADMALNRLMQENLSPRDLPRLWNLGVRAHQEGLNALVEYGPGEGPIARHLAGHAVYTQLQWLPFHAWLVAKELYRGE